MCLPNLVLLPELITFLFLPEKNELSLVEFEKKWLGNFFKGFGLPNFEKVYFKKSLVWPNKSH